MQVGLRLRRFARDRRGVAAIEFAMLAIPLFVVIMSGIEFGFMMFAKARLGGILERAARMATTGNEDTNGVDGTAIDAAPLPPHIWKLIAPIVPAARKVLAESGGGTVADIDSELVGIEHLRNTVRDLLQSSEIISNAVAEGRLGIVGANYRLAEGEAVPVITVGLDTDVTKGIDPETKEGSE